jgi:UDP-N-acetylmuramyl pentapeptide phosphotransferase/UDP-N-acetylglucosamine-1-phosphate transferase
VREYLLICVVALAVTFLMTPVVRALAVVVKAVTPLRERDVHTVPIPRLGGLAILCGLTAATLVARQLPYLKGVYTSGQMTGVLLGAVVICLIGAIDDIRELDWVTKFAGQALAAGVMAYIELESYPEIHKLKELSGAIMKKGSLGPYATKPSNKENVEIYKYAIKAHLAFSGVLWDKTNKYCLVECGFHYRISDERRGLGPSGGGLLVLMKNENGIPRIIKFIVLWEE